MKLRGGQGVGKSEGNTDYRRKSEKVTKNHKPMKSGSFVELRFLAISCDFLRFFEKIGDVGTRWGGFT